MPGKKTRGIAKGRRDVYEALKPRMNAGKTKGGRSAMARKAARTRKRKGRGRRK